jgi:hypothetical protein
MMPIGHEISLPLSFLQWTPPLQAVTLALLTLVQEDTPTVGAALLSANGDITWSTSFVGCFLGIWLGDAQTILRSRLDLSK